ncbi:MAG: O-methyltransferase [Candidatus Binataceae bacterium]
MPAALSLETCARIERATACQKPFGDNVYIVDQMQRCLRQRLERVASGLPAAGRLLAAVRQRPDSEMRRLFADTALRCAIVHSHEQIASGSQSGLSLADCERVFDEAARYVDEGGVDTPLQDGSLVPLGPEPYLGWVWSDEHPNDTYGRVFRELVSARYAVVPCTPGAGDVDKLMVGARLLHELLPNLAPSALAHARVVTCVPSAGSFTGVGSSSQFHLGGVIFLSRTLGTPWWVAEHLLHESLHQKFYDFRHGHSLMELGYARDGARPVMTPWNPSRLMGANLWNEMRVFAALHVYVHLALLAIVAEQRAAELESKYGPFRGMLESHRALARANYLARELRERCWSKVGPAGRALAGWLDAILDQLNPTPPVAGSYVHLCLDLYRREANQLQRSRGERDQSRPDKDLSALAAENLKTTRRVLSDIGAADELELLDKSVGEYTDKELGTRYAEIRRVISATLLKASPDGFRMDDSGEHDAAVREMVERSSDALYALMMRIPRPVAEAKRRAVLANFTMACEDGVGRLLAVQAAHLPSSSRVLEIGTGVGVGTAWIAVGLNGRADVEVVSVESDRRLSEAARAWPWPAHVHLETADAAQALKTLGTFDLIFADASPFKFQHVAELVNALRPGGMIIFDDMKDDRARDASTITPQEALRREVLEHPDLVALELEWSSGLLMASRPGLE